MSYVFMTTALIPAKIIVVNMGIVVTSIIVTTLAIVTATCVVVMAIIFITARIFISAITVVTAMIVATAIASPASIIFVATIIVNVTNIFIATTVGCRSTVAARRETNLDSAFGERDSALSPAMSTLRGSGGGCHGCRDEYLVATVAVNCPSHRSSAEVRSMLVLVLQLPR